MGELRVARLAPAAQEEPRVRGDGAGEGLPSVDRDPHGPREVQELGPQPEAQPLHVPRPQRDRASFDRAVDLGDPPVLLDDLGPEDPRALEGARTQRDLPGERVAHVALEEGEGEAVVPPVDDVVRPAGQDVQLGHRPRVGLAEGPHAALARPRRDHLVAVAVDEEERDAGEGGGVDGVVALEEGQVPRP